MIQDAVKLLATHNVHAYGSADLIKFERSMTRYYEREFERWQGNTNTPETYGVSSFEGDLVDKATYARSIDHYNRHLGIYRAFLDKEYLAYSMGYYGASDSSDGRISELTLEQAQEHKYRLIARRAGIQDGQNVLDIGCGYGGLAKYLFQNYRSIAVTGINPSTTQSEYIREAAGFDSNRFRLLQRRFDDMSSNSLLPDSFDRILSIGVLEHFSNLDLMFQYQKRLLKPGGKCLHHLIVSADTVPQFLNAEDTLISDYFPGGHIWPYSEPKRHNTHLNFVDSWFINGMNYWKTLDEWHKRFWTAIDRLFPEHLTISEVDSWNKYFVLSKTMFLANHGRSYGVGHYLYEKR